jgi:[protein-PII] uridylyltransferase
LLYTITRALSEQGLSIARARISTEATRAIDSFYVRDGQGRKVRDAEALRSIRERLAAQVE